MKHWKQPLEKNWYSIIIDGKRISTLEDSPKVQKEIKRINKLIGIEIVIASNKDLANVNAKTVIPKRIIDKMAQMCKTKQNRFN